jgi:hypothetical protein
VNTGPDLSIVMPVSVRLVGDRVATPEPVVVSRFEVGTDISVHVPVAVTETFPAGVAPCRGRRAAHRY